MNKLNTALTVLNYLKISDAKTIGEILHAKGLWGSPHSARVQSQKHLNDLVNFGKIDRGDGFYRTRDCKSNYGEHAKMLTCSLAEILKFPLTTTIYREISVPIGLRADALILCEKEHKGICFILEVVHTETHEYLKRKVEAWRNWKEARGFLSDLFAVKIPNFGFVARGLEVNGSLTFNQLLDILGG